MSDLRTRLVLLAALVGALALPSCSPSDPVQTVSFVLDLDAERVSRIEFIATPTTGRFVGDDGNCEIGVAAGPSLRTALDSAASSAPGTAVPIGVSAPTPPANEPRGVVASTTTSSVTTSSMSTTSTSSTSTTTTTLQPQSCRLVFRMPDSVSIGSMQWTTDYSAAPGFVAGEGDEVQCASLVAGTLAAFNDDDAAEAVESGLISLDGFDGPTDLAECTFVAQATPVAADFTITVSEAVAPDFSDISPVPAVVVSEIECDGVIDTTTTTVSVTTTTMAGDGTCGNGIRESGEECDDGNVVSGDGCDGNCDAEFSFTSTVDSGGALTVEVVNGGGIPPGAALAFCRFQGDLDDANLRVVVVGCGLPDGDSCNATTLSAVSVSTTTTTTSSTSTTSTTAAASRTSLP